MGYERIHLMLPESQDTDCCARKLDELPPWDVVVSDENAMITAAVPGCWTPYDVGDPCQICHKHKSTDVLTASVLDWVHGDQIVTCRCCLLKTWITEAEQMQAHLAEWKALLGITECAKVPA